MCVGGFARDRCFIFRAVYVLWSLTRDRGKRRAGFRTVSRGAMGRAFQSPRYTNASRLTTFKIPAWWSTTCPTLSTVVQWLLRADGSNISQYLEVDGRHLVEEFHRRGLLQAALLPVPPRTVKEKPSAVRTLLRVAVQRGTEAPRMRRVQYRPKKSN